MDHLYELLGIEPTYDTAKIREAYYEKQKLVASDKSVSFSELYSAYEKLIEYAEKMAEMAKDAPPVTMAAMQPELQAASEAADTENQRRLAAAIQLEAQRKAAQERVAAESVRSSAAAQQQEQAKKPMKGFVLRLIFPFVLMIVILAVGFAVNSVLNSPDADEDTRPQPKQVSYLIIE